MGGSGSKESSFSKNIASVEKRVLNSSLEILQNYFKEYLVELHKESNNWYKFGYYPEPKVPGRFHRWASYSLQKLWTVCNFQKTCDYKTFSAVCFYSVEMMLKRVPNTNV